MAKAGNQGCDHAKVSRRARSGLLDALMYRLGRYPWTCRLCGTRLYFKDRRPGDAGGAVRADHDAVFHARAKGIRNGSRETVREFDDGEPSS